MTPGPVEPQKPNRIIPSLISLAMVVLMVLLIWQALKVEPNKIDDGYYQIISYFDEGKVTEYDLNLSNRKLTYVLKGEKEKKSYTVPSADLFVADVHDQVREYNKEHPDAPIKMNYESGTSGYWLTQLLPMAGFTILMAVMLYMVVKKIGAGMLDDTKRSMAFGKARLKTGQDAQKTTFDDVAGLDEEKEDLEEVVEFLRDPQRYSELGARIPKGVILVGPPGTGKTLLARAVAGEANATFLSISGSDFVEMYVGVGASRVRDLFDTAKKNTPSIIFIDEIDAVGRHRGAGMGGGHDEREQTLNQLLVEMDGFGENVGVIVMAATNRPDILDPALLRPGRFDRQITVNYPDVKGREAILKVHARNKPIAPDVSLSEIARATSGFTGADLENLLNEAALLAARRHKRALTKKEIEEATVKVIVGTEKKSKIITDDEKKLTAYHEAGHAVTNFYLEMVDPVHQISIIPRGMAGGYTMSLPKEDKSSYVSKKQMLDQLVTLLGGRVAEAIILGDISTGASNDIERATNIARSMITKYGMSSKLGPITYGDDNDEVFLGKNYSHVRNYSEETASIIDKEIENLITDAYERADEILRLHIDKLHMLAKFLMKYEKIDGDTFQTLMSSEDFDIENYNGQGSKNESASEENQSTNTEIPENSQTPDAEKASADEEADGEETSENKIEAVQTADAEDASTDEEAGGDEASEDKAEDVQAPDAEDTSADEGTDGEKAPEDEDEDAKTPAVEIDDSSIGEENFDDIIDTLNTENKEVVLSEAELELKRELDRQNGLISAEDEYAQAELSPDAISEADISDYLEDEKSEKDAEDTDNEPRVEGLSGSGASISEETSEDSVLPGMTEDEEFKEEIEKFNNDPMDIGGFINNMTPSYTDEERAAVEKVLGKRGGNKKAPEKETVEEDSSEAPDEVSEDFNYASAKKKGSFTENDEIYALYELLKATRDFNEDDDSDDWKKKMKDD